MDPRHLIHQYFVGNMDDHDVQKLNQLLADNAELRREFRYAAEIDAALRETSIERSVEDVHRQTLQHADPTGASRSLGSWLFAACLTIAASTLIAIGLRSPTPATVATLASSENAAWESSLPTSPGADLTAGILNLRSGIATIQFRSGAELVIEAPAQLELVSEMRARLNSGTAVMEVPESAMGFILDTPDGYAIDFGTRFAVNIDEQRNATDFELLEGEIEVHHSESGESLRLNQVGAAASVSTDSLRRLKEVSMSESAEPATDKPRQILRIATHGRCGTAMPNFARRKRSILPEFLYAKNSPQQKWDFRSFFEFDCSNVQLDRLSSACLRLNQVRSYRGSASLLPKLNRFSVYGLTNPAKANWKIESTWEESPGPEDGVLIGTFEIPRSQQRGAIEISTNELLAFLKEHGPRPTTFILVRETGRVSGTGSAMTHMFASDQHPEAVGPQLELQIR